ncbi:MAG: glucoamylase family protein [Ignavibacteriaceae bacterium]
MFFFIKYLKKKVFITIEFLLLLFITVPGFSQPYIIFYDSPNDYYYDATFGYYNTPSILVLTNGDKCPVDTAHKYSGVNSLRIRWKSLSDGDWGLAIAQEGWTSHNYAVKDSIIFRAFALAQIDSVSLPTIYLEDDQNNKTPKQELSNFITQVSANNWIRVAVPISYFVQNPGDADLTRIKTIYFGQNNADGNIHTIYIDEIKVVSVNDLDFTPPAAPTGLTTKALHVLINLTWNQNNESDIAGYNIYRSTDGNNYNQISSVSSITTNYNDRVGVPPETFYYKISAFDSNLNESVLSDAAIATTTSLPDSILLDSVQEATFKYFWDYAHPVSGLARERYGSGDIVTIGGSGFGVMAILVGIERGYITREQGIARILTILNFLTNKADRFHGVFPHWLNGTSGTVIPFSQYDDGGDIVETSFMIQGLLAARQYFNKSTSDEEQIRNLITAIWESVEWDWYRKDNGNYLYWHWSPNYGWQMNFPLIGWMETMITYLLAIASPTHPVPASLYHDGWASSSTYLNGNYYYGIKLFVGPPYGAPLFWTHYSFLGFDPRNKKDAYTNYFINNRNTALINHAYCVDNPHNYSGYDTNTWGLTASDGPFGYNAFSPTNDNGTIAPTAAISSIVYTPQESITAIKSFFYEYGVNLWGTYGFKDAFNLSESWFAQSYLAIDQGPIIVMIENYRTQLLWNNFMANPEIQPMLDAIGFIPDSTTDVDDEIQTVNDFRLVGNYPNPFNPSTTIVFNLPVREKVTVTIFNYLGEKVKDLINNEYEAGENQVVWNGLNDDSKQVSSGIYLYKISTGNNALYGKMILQK